MDHGNQKLISYGITAAVVAIVFALRFRAMNKERRLKLEFMWILPAIMVAATVFLFVQFTPHGADWLWLGLIFAVGATIGWWRGRLIPIAIDPDTHELNTKPSPAAILFLLGLFVVRFALKAFLESEAQAWHINAVLLTDGFVVLGVGLFAVSRLEMALRAIGLLREARATKAAQATA
ncbi:MULTISPECIES: CcdC protein domain-containing protein [unclassified Caulobacter]|uniref:CcdC protein domain-containing protein n=1 Tax=unclassified Caulobacter TaxID=2648921 RepID=UPI001304CFB7|nr:MULTISPECIES: CcdC protein domain-containing protein [unclassified Caulobacter]